jgi:hypothetical protein
VNAEKRLALIVRVVGLLRGEIERAGGRYDGSMTPNLTSITDLATIEDRYLGAVEQDLAALERERTNPRREYRK